MNGNGPERGPATSVRLFEGASGRSRLGPGQWPRFYQLFLEQLEVPEPDYGQPGDDRHLTVDEKLVLIAIAGFVFAARGPSRVLDRQIAAAVGWRGSEEAVRRRVQRVLHGHWVRGVKWPGLCHPSRDWVRILPGRLIAPTERWTMAGQTRIHSPTEIDPEGINASATTASQGEGPKELTQVRQQSRFFVTTESHSSAPPMYPPSLRERESSSSACAGDSGHDDDDDFLRPVEGDPERGMTASMREAVEAAAPFFGGDRARASAFIRDRAADIENTTGGRWDRYAAALRKAATVKSAPRRAGNLHRYCLTIVKNGVEVAPGVPAETPTVDPRAPSPAAEKAAREAAEAARIATQEEAHRTRARESRLRATWDALAETDREAIRADVKAANPALVRFPSMIAALCLDALDAAMAGDTAGRGLTLVSPPAAGASEGPIPGNQG